MWITQRFVKRINNRFQAHRLLAVFILIFLESCFTYDVIVYGWLLLIADCESRQISIRNIGVEIS